jgi:rsbT co-antagonist protein RsbR
VIIDVTGVDVIDTMTANHFMQMIRAASLLGAHCVVTGMSPHTARTIVSIGVDLGSIRTLRSLKDGLKHCLHYLHGRSSGAATREEAQWTS